MAIAVIAGVTICVGSACSSDGGTITRKAGGGQSGDIASTAQKAGRGDPSEIDVPAVEDRGAVREFLAGDGSALVELLDVTGPLAADPEPTAGSCEAAAAELSGLGTPEELLGLAVDIPDAPTSEIAQNLIASVSRTVASCDGEDVERLAFEWSLWRERVDEVMS